MIYTWPVSMKETVLMKIANTLHGEDAIVSRSRYLLGAPCNSCVFTDFLLLPKLSDRPVNTRPSVDLANGLAACLFAFLLARRCGNSLRHFLIYSKEQEGLIKTAADMVKVSGNSSTKNED